MTDPPPPPRELTDGDEPDRLPDGVQHIADLLDQLARERGWTDRLPTPTRPTRTNETRGGRRA